jgi:hypothetical protein
LNYRFFLIIVLIALTPLFAQAQDRVFVNTYQSTTLPKGAKDIEMWNTFKVGRNYFYNRLDQRIELEVGLTDKLQTSVYINTEHTAEGAHKDTLGGIADTSMDGIFKSTLFSVSSEWKLKLSDPVANRVGSALYAEFTFAPSEIEIEGKLIMDKRTEKNVFALNLVAEYEMKFDVKKGKAEAEEEMQAEFDLAYMRMLNPRFGLGLEAREQNVFVGGKKEHSAIFGGPTLSYFGDSFFLILNASPQLANLQVNKSNPEKLDLNEFEKMQARLLIGFSF